MSRRVTVSAAVYPLTRETMLDGYDAVFDGSMVELDRVCSITAADAMLLPVVERALGTLSGYERMALTIGVEDEAVIAAIVARSDDLRVMHGVLTRYFDWLDDEGAPT